MNEVIKTPKITRNTLKERDAFLDKFKEYDQKQLFKACSEDPAVFAHYLLGITLYGWQWLVSRDLVNGKKRIILNTSRQIGKSYLVAVMALWNAIFNKGCSSNNSNTKIVIVSASDAQAKKLLMEVKNLIRLGDAHCREKYSKHESDVFGVGLFSLMIDDSQTAENTKTCITFKSSDPKFGLFLQGSKIGSFVKSLPPTDVIRGESADVLIVDEAGKIDDEVYNGAISKVGDKYDAVRFITSTPRGTNGFYFEHFDPFQKRKSNSWSRWLFTVDSISFDDPEDYSRRVADIKEQNEMGKQFLVRQEYYCEFVQNESNFFDPEKIDAAIEDYSPVESFSGECDMGVDFGGMQKSRSVITITHMDDADVIRRIYCHKYGVQEDASIVEDIELLRKRFNIQRIIVDNCPAADILTRQMEDKGWEISRMTFRTDKVRKYGDFRALMNRGKIKTYNDSDLISEMKAMITSKGRENTKIMAPPGYTDDVIDSFVIATYHQTEITDGFNFYDIDDF